MTKLSGLLRSWAPGLLSVASAVYVLRCLPPLLAPNGVIGGLVFFVAGALFACLTMLLVLVLTGLSFSDTYKSGMGTTPPGEGRRMRRRAARDRKSAQVTRQHASVLEYTPQPGVVYQGRYAGTVWTVPATLWSRDQELKEFPPPTEGPAALARKWHATLSGNVLTLAPHHESAAPQQHHEVVVNLEGMSIDLLPERWAGHSPWKHKIPLQLSHPTRAVLHGDRTFYLFVETGAVKEQWYAGLKSCMQPDSYLATTMQLYQQYCTYLASLALVPQPQLTVTPAPPAPVLGGKVGVVSGKGGKGDKQEQGAPAPADPGQRPRRPWWKPWGGGGPRSSKSSTKPSSRPAGHSASGGSSRPGTPRASHKGRDSQDRDNKYSDDNGQDDKREDDKEEDNTGKQGVLIGSALDAVVATPLPPGAPPITVPLSALHAPTDACQEPQVEIAPQQLVPLSALDSASNEPHSSPPGAAAAAAAAVADARASGDSVPPEQSVPTSGRLPESVKVSSLQDATTALGPPSEILPAPTLTSEDRNFAAELADERDGASATGSNPLSDAASSMNSESSLQLSNSNLTMSTSTPAFGRASLPNILAANLSAEQPVLPATESGSVSGPLSKLPSLPSHGSDPSLATVEAGESPARSRPLPSSSSMPNLQQLAMHHDPQPAACGHAGSVASEPQAALRNLQQSLSKDSAKDMRKQLQKQKVEGKLQKAEADRIKAQADKAKRAEKQQDEARKKQEKQQAKASSRAASHTSLPDMEGPGSQPHTPRGAKAQGPAMAPEAAVSGPDTDPAHPTGVPVEGLHGLNMLLARMGFEALRNYGFEAWVSHLLQKRLDALKRPGFLEPLTLVSLDLGASTPQIKAVRAVAGPMNSSGDAGCWPQLQFDVVYTGCITATITTKVELDKASLFNSFTKKRDGSKDDGSETGSNMGGMSSMPSSLFSEGSGASNAAAMLQAAADVADDSMDQGGKGFWSSLQQPFKRFMGSAASTIANNLAQTLSNMPVQLVVNVTEFEGSLMLWMSPPPSDRLWLSFATPPHIELAIRPVLGNRMLRYGAVLARLSGWIRSKIIRAMHRSLVYPACVDIKLPSKFCTNLDTQPDTLRPLHVPTAAAASAHISSQTPPPGGAAATQNATGQPSTSTVAGGRPPAAPSSAGRPARGFTMDVKLKPFPRPDGSAGSGSTPDRAVTAPAVTTPERKTSTTPSQTPKSAASDTLPHARSSPSLHTKADQEKAPGSVRAPSSSSLGKEQLPGDLASLGDQARDASAPVTLEELNGNSSLDRASQPDMLLDLPDPNLPKLCTNSSASLSSQQPGSPHSSAAGPANKPPLPVQLARSAVGAAGKGLWGLGALGTRGLGALGSRAIGAVVAPMLGPTVHASERAAFKQQQEAAAATHHTD